MKAITLKVLSNYGFEETLLKPFNSNFVLPGNASFISAMKTKFAELASNPEAKKEICKEIATGDFERRKEIASARLDRIRINILENLIGLDFFQIIDLGNNEQPQLVIEKDQIWQVTQIGEHGGNPVSQFINGDTIIMFTPYIISSDLAIYPIRSALLGDFVGVGDRVNARVALDVKRKMDIDFLNLIDANFEATFANPANIYQLDPRIKNYPTGNYLNLSSEGKLNLNVFAAIFQHFANFGEEGPKVRNIYIPTDAISDIWKIPSIVAGFNLGGAVQDPVLTVDPQTRKQIIDQGTINNLFGNEFRLRPINTLNSGELLVSTDRPFGWVYMKPDMDKVNFYEEKFIRVYLDKQNHEGVEMQKVIVPVIPSPLKVNALKVKFK